MFVVPRIEWIVCMVCLSMFLFLYVSCIEYKWNVIRGVLPLSLVFVAMITFNNLCLKYVEVSFYNVARSLTIVINVIFTYTLLGEKTSLRTCACLFLVIIGFVVGSEGEINFSWLGTTYGVLSSAFVSLNAIYTKKVMPMVDDDKWKLAFYNNMNAAILFVPMILFSGELDIIAQFSYLLTSAYFWVMMMIAGILGFAIGIVTVMQINYTSPLTHNISGTAKACVQTILAYLIWQNESTWKANLGVALVIFGSLAYTLVRMREMERPKAEYIQVSRQAAVPNAVDGEEEDIEMAQPVKAFAK